MFGVDRVIVIVDMRYTQFRTIPPLSDVQELFCKVTGVKFFAESTWFEWIRSDLMSPDDYLHFIEYIRPSHRKILLDTVNGNQKNPCSFLRQLLRPHGYTIVFEPTCCKGAYTLRLVSDIKTDQISTTVHAIDTTEKLLDWSMKK